MKHVARDGAPERHHEQRDGADEQVPPAPPDHQHGERRPPQGEHSERGRIREHPGRAFGLGEPGRADPLERAQDRVVDNVRGDRRLLHVADQHPGDDR
jgi:hypothetical protein